MELWVLNVHFLTVVIKVFLWLMYMDWNQFWPIVHNKDNEKIVLITGFLAISCIFMYGKYRCDHGEYQDPFLKKFGVWDLDGWSVLHFGAFLIAGYIAPNQWWLLWLLGLFWELFEEGYERYKPGFLKAFGDCASTDPETGRWWFGRFSDIIMNTIGLLLGIYLRQQNVQIPVLNKLCNVSDGLC